MSAPFPLPHGVRFDGEQTCGDRTLLLFTLLDEAHPAYGTTIALRDPATPETLAEKLALAARNFAAG